MLPLHGKLLKGLLITGTIVLTASSAHAQNKSTGNISLAIASGTSAGYDLYGRLVARHIGRFLPGQPNVIPRNMPGAGSIIAANWLANIAPKDGTAIAILQNGTAFEPLFGTKQARFDGRKFGWIGNLNKLVNIAVVWHETPFHSADDIFTKEIVVGGNPGNTTTMPNMLNSVLKAKFKVIAGYTGSSEISLAMERRELDGIVGTSWDSFKATKADWVVPRKARVLLQASFDRHPELDGVANLDGYVKNRDDRQLLDTILARQIYGRPFAAPPGMDPAALQYLRDAFQKMAVDKDFLADAARANAEIVVNSGEEIAELVNRIYSSPKAIVDRAIEELRRAGG